MVEVGKKSVGQKKTRVKTALYYEFDSWKRTRRADYGLVGFKSVAVVVRGVITRLPFSLLLKGTIAGF